MLGSALYFPHIDIRDPAWLRSTLLFWDDIQTIVPSSIGNPYRESDTEICFKEGVLRPLNCDLYPDVLDSLGKKVINLGNRHSGIEQAIRRTASSVADAIPDPGPIAWEIDSAFDGYMHYEKMTPEMRLLALTFGQVRLHRGKVPPGLRGLMRDIESARIRPEKLPYALRELLDYHRFEDGDGEWLLVNSHFADAYMAALAADLSSMLELSPLTSGREAHGMAFRFLFDQVVDESSRHAEGVLMNVTMRGLAVDPSTPIQNIIKFKRDNRDQYLEFKDSLEELSKSISSPNNSSTDEMLDSARSVYRTKVERSLRQLKRELEHQKISSVWEGALTAATVSASTTSALAVFGGLTGPTLLGAAVAVAGAAVGVRGYLAGRKLRIGSPYSYLHDVRQSFGLPEFS